MHFVVKVGIELGSVTSIPTPWGCSKLLPRLIYIYVYLYNGLDVAKTIGKPFETKIPTL